MSKFLINEPPLQVLPSLAKAIGLNEAIVLQQIHYWINQPGTGKIHNDRKWIYNSIQNWQKDNFPFWSDGTIKRTIASLKKQKLILSKNLNKKKYDRTLWYTIDYEQLDKIGDPVIGSICTDGQDQGDPMDKDKMTPPIPETTSETTTETTEYSVPNGTMSPPPAENSKPPKSKPESDDTVVTEMLAAWGRLFPDKPQPRPTTYRSKIQTQLKMPQFREGWLEAMEWAANSPTCQNESWFHFGFFVQQTKGEYGWEKCLRHWMEWKDKKIRANGNGRTDCVNDVWQSIKIALGKPGKPDISDRALQAVGMVPGGWRRFKEQDVRFIDQLKPLFEEAYERTKQQQPATA